MDCLIKSHFFYLFVAKKYSITMVKPTIISIAKQASTTDRFKPTFAKSPITGAKVGPIKFRKLCPDIMACSIMG